MQGQTGKAACHAADQTRARYSCECGRNRSLQHLCDREKEKRGLRRGTVDQPERMAKIGVCAEQEKQRELYDTSNNHRGRISLLHLYQKPSAYGKERPDDEERYGQPC